MEAAEEPEVPGPPEAATARCPEATGPEGAEAAGPEASPEGAEAANPEATVAADAKEFTFDEPMHLLRPSEDHRSLVADSAALQRLHALGPVTVLSVVGNQRGGKSTLMNLLHSRRLQGFQTGHYLDPQTHGLWVWPKPHPRRPGLTVLLVDTEGLDSPHVPQHYNWLISAVTLLMSDVYMYQTKGSIEQSSAERLDMILKVAEQLGKAGGGGGQESGSFLWLLRDHQLQMKHTPKEELVEKLDPAQVRALGRTFSDFDCVPLPRPAADAVLRQLDRHGFQDLSGDFREEFVVLERRLLELLCRPRRLLEQELTGAGLAELLRQYLASIAQRRGALADICDMPTQRQMLRQMAGRRAVDAGLRAYEERLAVAGLRGAAAQLPVRPAELLAGHEAARQAAGAALEAEAAAAGLEAEEAQAFGAQLEERLASWDVRLQLAGGSADLAGADEEGDSEAAVMLEMGTCRRLAPVLARAATLKGGALLDLWQENSRHSLAGYHRWLQRFSGLKDRALRNFKEDAPEPQEAATVLAAFYAEMRSAFGEARGTEASQLGPWAAVLRAGSVCGDEPGQLLLSTAQQGDDLVLALAEASLSDKAEGLQRQLEEQRRALSSSAEAACAELRAGLEAASAELPRLQDGLARLEERTAKAEADLREAAAKAEERACARAAERSAAQLEEGLQGLRAEVREALRNLKAAMSSELQERLAQQEQRSQEAAARSAEALAGVEARGREAAAAQREALEAQGARAREDAMELRRALEAAEARLTESLRAAEVGLREQLQRASEAGEARAEARGVELQASFERLQSREEEAAQRRGGELAELRGRTEALAAKLEAAGAATASRIADCERTLAEAKAGAAAAGEQQRAAADALGASIEALRGSQESLQRQVAQLDETSKLTGSTVESLQARAGAAEKADDHRQEALEALEGRLGSLQTQVTERIRDGVGALEEQLAEASARLREQIAQQGERAEDRHGEARTEAAAAKAAAGRAGAEAREEAEQLWRSLQATERHCSQELDMRGPLLEAHCQESAEQLLREGLEQSLRYIEVAEAQRLELRLEPLEKEVASLAEGAAEDRQRTSELMERINVHTVWESLALLGSRLTDIQETVDNLSLRGAGLMGC